MKKYFISVLVLSLCTFSGFAAQEGRPAMSNRIMSAPRYTASVNQLNGITTGTTSVSVDNTSANSTGTEHVLVAETEEKVDMREAEKNACINNNIGVGNTFVWASRYSNTSNYSSMVEDVVNPENNVCFVRVELKSDDESRVAVSDIAPKYFMWGESIECGSWADRGVLEKRILDAKKGNRIAGIVASTVGGAGVGVGVMELFGNRMIGGKVEGQKDKSLDEVTIYRSQLLTLKEKGQVQQYNDYVKSLKLIRKACDESKQNLEGFDCVAYAALLDEFGR